MSKVEKKRKNLTFIDLRPLCKYTHLNIPWSRLPRCRDGANRMCTETCLEMHQVVTDFSYCTYISRLLKIVFISHMFEYRKIAK